MRTSTSALRRRRTPAAVAASALALGLGMGLVPWTTGSWAASATSTSTSIADAFVRSEYPTKNYGSKSELRADGSPTIVSYARFPVGPQTGQVTRATLRVFTSSAARSGLAVRAVRGAWTESSVTYATAPALGDVVDTSPATVAGAWTTLDVTPLVAASTGGTVDLAITTPGTTAVSLQSRESGPATAPQLVVETTTSTSSPTPSPTSTAGTAPAPTASATPTAAPATSRSVRAAFYYPWFSNAWTQSGVFPYTKYEPSLGYYDITEDVVRRHISSMQHGHISSGISSWWGQGHHTDAKLPVLLKAAAGTGFTWSTYYERESLGDPTVEQIRGDLTYLRDRYAGDPAHLRVEGKPVIFVYADPADGCAMAARWKQANTVGFHVVLKVFSGYRACASQPEGWHQYGPAVAESDQTGYSYTISPGFWHQDEAAPRLARDLPRWKESIQRMNSSGAPWQLVTTMNEWGEGTSVESALGWATASGHGAYLDALHAAPPPAGTPTQSPTPTQSAAPAPSPAPTPSPTSSAQPTAAPAPPSTGGATVVWALGDACDDDDEAVDCEDVASVIAADPETDAVLGLGDMQYENGSLSLYRQYFDPKMGAGRGLKDKWIPSPGNHEYLVPGAAGYFDYWGAQAGDRAKGYFATELGGWTIVSANTNCSQAGGCSASSAQGQFIAARLAAPAQCEIVFGHHPAITDGVYSPGTAAGKEIFDRAHAGRAELFLSGHDHEYQRFAPMDGSLRPTSTGTRQIVSGAGGKNLTAFQSAMRSESRQNSTYGAVRLVLRDGSYTGSFVDVDGVTRDAFSGTCH